MAVLTRDQRNLLSKVVLHAREVAERAEAKALHMLGVDEPDAPGHLTPEQRTLRRALRAQARQLGDHEDPRKKGSYELTHLTEKIAYDQWHRMLFARFLAENDLLISPKHGVSVSLQDCRELAPELGLRDGWDVAARLAGQMLPQIFRGDDPAGRIELAPEDRTTLQELVTSLAREIFLADDSLGWVYQFWQAKRKDEVNRSEKKIGADELPAVTQLFTEHYMVLFLLHNTLGAWWAGKHLGKWPELASSTKSEEELRQACALPGYEWTYLRFVRERDSGPWRPAAGTFEGWPERAAEITVLDPCCGSGHFLVEAFRILVSMRMVEEALSAREACDAVLRDNLFGLEIDPRCTQIAAFNLGFAAWVYPNGGGQRPLLELHIACSGLGVEAKEEDWLKLAGKDNRLREGMRRLYRLFKDAPTVGSLIDPRREFEASPGELEFDKGRFEELRPLLEQALVREDVRSDVQVTEAGVAAQGMAKAAALLAGSYTLVATNVPYLQRTKQDERLRDYCERLSPAGKSDLATVFLDRCLASVEPLGTVAIVSPQNWLFLTRYKKFRERLLRDCRWHFAAQLGEHAFESSQAAGAFPSLTAISCGEPHQGSRLLALDVLGPQTSQEKAASLRDLPGNTQSQAAQVRNPDFKILLSGAVEGPLLERHAEGMAGIQSGDYDRFGRCFWEMARVLPGWILQQSTVRETIPFGGREHVFIWEGGNGRFMEYVRERLGSNVGAWVRGLEAWGKAGVAISSMRHLPVSHYTGEAWDNNTAVILPGDPRHLPAIWAFCSSPEFAEQVRRIDKTLKVTNATLAKVPFDLERWQKVVQENYPNGLPRPFSDDSTQWIFHGHPCGSVVWDEEKKWTAHGLLRTDATVLQVAVARLLGHRWPAEPDPKMELADEQREWVRRCEELLDFADKDGIVCLSPVRGEASGNERLRVLLEAAHGSEWSTAKQAELLEQVGYPGKTPDDWLRNGFFEQHCQIFHQRPFIWHIWDGRRDGFSALVNYHKLDRSNLEKLIYTYLGDWIARQRAAVEAGEEGSDARLTAALELKEKLEKILEGEKPYDIFVRWKPLEQQPIGWEPDLNDGVRLNIRPFVIAGVLRKNPRINWSKDRGKDIPSAPWYKIFKGDRINDHHLTLEEKRNAKEKTLTDGHTPEKESRR